MKSQYAIIGGTGVYESLFTSEKICVETGFGEIELDISDIQGNSVVFIAQESIVVLAHLRVTFEVLHWIVVSFSLFFLHFSLSLFLMRQIRLSYIFEGDEAQMMAMENGGNEIDDYRRLINREIQPACVCSPSRG